MIIALHKNARITPAIRAELVQYAYDATSRRVQRQHITSANTTTTTYHYDAWNVIYERTTNSTPTESTPATSTTTRHWGLDLSNTLQGAGGVGGLLHSKTTNNGTLPNNATSTHHYLYDANGNVSDLLTPTGTTHAHYEYDPFGNTLNTTTQENPYRFSTKPYDPITHLHYYGYRFYCAELGRWLNRDPSFELGFELSSSEKSFLEEITEDEHFMRIEVNQNLFVKNSPVSQTDNLGRDITLETGNVDAGWANNKLHQQVCVDRWNTASRNCTEANKWKCCHIGKDCFSFAATGPQWPQFSTTWLGWDSQVFGAIIKGEIYEPDPVPDAEIAQRHVTTMIQDVKWFRYMRNVRRGTTDGYSVARHNCRQYSQWEFRDAPLHW
jgi:RHS repeat-associated protein